MLFIIVIPFMATSAPCGLHLYCHRRSTESIPEERNLCVHDCVKIREEADNLEKTVNRQE
jgi:hypothetical protein